MTVRFVCDRGVSHEIVRHRIASFSQESTRYCNYSKDKFGREITVISPCFWSIGSVAFDAWATACSAAERAYFYLIDHGAKPQEARSVLPNSLKTEIVVTANLREWRHIFRLRCSEKAHPQMREVMLPLFSETRTRIPILFDS
jgi:thymidylate synthase (FAD)